jgi:hypothetical protein
VPEYRYTIYTVEKQPKQGYKPPSGGFDDQVRGQSSTYRARFAALDIALGSAVTSTIHQPLLTHNMLLRPSRLLTVALAITSGTTFAQSSPQPSWCNLATLTGVLTKSIVTHPFNGSKNPILFLRLSSPLELKSRTDKECPMPAVTANEVQLIIDQGRYANRIGKSITFKGMLLPPGGAIDVKPAILAGAEEVSKE